MKNILKLAALAALPFSWNTGAAVAAPPTHVFNCTPGSSSAINVSANAGFPETIEVSNASGSTIGFYATLSNASGTGGLVYSGGGAVLTFPGTLSATISTPIASAYMLLEPFGTDASLSIVCNPGSGTADTVENLSQNSASALSAIRDAQRQNLVGTVRWAVDRGVISADMIDVFETLDLPEQERAAILDSFYGPILQQYSASLVKLRTLMQQPGQSESAYAYYAEMISQLESYVRDLTLAYNRTIGLNSRFAYGPLPQQADALNAIDAAAGTGVVANTFNVLGYGPSGGFESNIVLAQGESWTITAATTAAISQTRQAGGNTDSASGRASINIVGAVADGTALGLGLNLGTTSEWGAGINDLAWHYGIDLILAHRLSSDLMLTGGLGYELSNHNFTAGAGTGSMSSHLYSARLGLTGNIPMIDYTLTPRVDVALEHETAPSVTLSNGTTVPGFDATTGRATVGTEISHMYLVRGENGAMIVKPYMGFDASLSLTHRQPAGGAAVTNVGYGLGLTGGVAVTVESGMTFDLSTRLNKSGDTLGASVTGKVSASF